MKQERFVERSRGQTLLLGLLASLALVGLWFGVAPTQAASITMGETTVLTTDDGSNGNLLLAQRATLSQPATVVSLSFYVTAAAGNLRLAIYDATGPGGGPGAKKAETNSITPIAGWNTANTIVSVPLPAGIYWLAYLPSSNNLQFRVMRGSGATKYASYTYAAMPATFPVSPSSCDCYWSLYATLVTDTAPPDTTTPAGSIVINGGAAATSSRFTTLTLSATAGSSSVTQMRFSNTGSSYSAAEAYATTKAWTLSMGAGTKTVYAQFKDAAGNWSSAYTDTIVLDTTAPTISAVASGNITNTSATITWTTNEPATSQVEYGLGASLGNSTAIDNNLVAAHSVVLTGLAAQTSYVYRVRSKDAAAREGIGVSNTFTTLGGPPDGVPPSMPGNVVATPVSPSAIDISWAASTDNVGVSGYKLFRDGSQITTVTAGTSYSDIDLSPSTTYTYRVSAYDAANNNSALSEVVAATTTLPDTTPPTVSISSPANNAAVAGTVVVTASVSDDVAVSGVVFQVDGTDIGPGVGSPPFAINLDTTTLSKGAHVLMAIAEDTSNNTAVSSPISIVVDNGAVAPPGIPTLIQHVSTSSNYDPSEPGNNFRIHLADPALANNCLILGISYPNGLARTVAINDDRGNIWMAGPSTNNGTTTSRIFYVTGAIAGTRDITVTFNNKLSGFQAVLSEFYNVALTGANDGSSANASSSNPTITAGNFATTAAGDLIYNYVATNNFGAPITNIAAGTGSSLLSADRLRAAAAQYGIQSSAGSVNPTMTVTSASGSMNSVAIALKAATAGTAPAPGIRVVHVYHGFWLGTPAVLQFPSTGNLLVFTTSFGTGNSNISSISSTPSNAWTKVTLPPVAATDPQFLYAANAATSPALTFAISDSAKFIQFVIYDVTGASASPYDTVGKATGTNTNNANVVNAPAISPTGPGLIIASLPMGHGPPVGCLTTGCYFDGVTYPGEADGSTFESSDGYAHLYNSAAGSVSFNWQAASVELPSGWWALAVAFKGAGRCWKVGRSSPSMDSIRQDQRRVECI